MENFSYSTYPDSGNSSPRSREIDCESASWDEPPSSNYKVKFMCSYGGKILPRTHDNQLAYVGGDTKILAVERNVRFSAFISKLSALSDSDVCFKYQLPGEDLDALISVTNDEDLEHMMLEYDRMLRASAKPARLRLFMFSTSTSSNFGSADTKSERQWFVDALNSVQIQGSEDASPSAAAAANPDFLFGFDKSHAPTSPAEKVRDAPPPAPAVTETFSKEVRGGSDCGSEERHVMEQAEIQRQIHELQMLQIASQDQANARAYYGDQYGQKVQAEKAPPPVPVTMQAAYWPERYMTSGCYPLGQASGPTEQQQQQPVYLIPTTAAMYHPTPGMRPMTGQVGQGYQGMQRMLPEIYREQQVYSAVPQQSVQQQKVGAYGTEGMGMLRPQMVGDHGFGYDGAGRQVFYAAAGGVVPQYQAAVEGRQGGGAFNQEGKVVTNPSHTSTM
ncbi:hypothetical protein RJ639_047644 [Escallonia herrerae]|uniref:PB1 domain-containing protein n=1 Tax=Escallonia herrerae TaxID=1293975 RepID=A0AA88W7I4_9ASTE|nr:hypothetical protein RJ639_047644 [Escallonia herrerae]